MPPYCEVVRKCFSRGRHVITLSSFLLFDFHKCLKIHLCIKINMIPYLIHPEKFSFLLSKAVFLISYFDSPIKNNTRIGIFHSLNPNLPESIIIEDDSIISSIHWTNQFLTGYRHSCFMNKSVSWKFLDTSFRWLFIVCLTIGIILKLLVFYLISLLFRIGINLEDKLYTRKPNNSFKVKTTISVTGGVVKVMSEGQRTSLDYYINQIKKIVSVHAQLHNSTKSVIILW